MPLFFYLSLAACALGVTHAASSTSYTPAFTSTQIAQIRENAVNASTESWEIGTLLEALTQLDSYHLSVFGATSVPANSSSGSLTEEAIVALDDVLAKRPSNIKPFMVNGAAADPASIGVADMTAGITTREKHYSEVAASQLEWLLHHVPRDDKNISISHRQEQFQAWADYVSMVPPFIAYYAAASGGDYGAGLMAFAYEQVKGYREILQDPETKLWRHIIKGNWNDTGLWATGNGWAAFGALRVEATIAKSEYASNMRSETRDLRAWTNEILNATWTRQEPSGLVKNYMERDTFEDAAGTALLAAATYRYSLITETTDYIPYAEKAFARLIDLTDKNGWLKSVVNPYNFRDEGEHSPEAQSFLLYLHVSSQRFYDWQGSPARALANALLYTLNFTATSV